MIWGTSTWSAFTTQDVPVMPFKSTELCWISPPKNVMQNASSTAISFFLFGKQCEPQWEQVHWFFCFPVHHVLLMHNFCYQGDPQVECYGGLDDYGWQRCYLLSGSQEDQIIQKLKKKIACKYFLMNVRIDRESLQAEILKYPSIGLTQGLAHFFLVL